ncbi:MAG TPA: M1 family metallopeptidase [Dinghuibacter sp.]|uniref:M1 family metallopeptidase n=1 Tax=Dinghuibacter sp. TaxID=2024697 RepID=UPI002BAA3F2D|nr:M1 family metallopeptidase [Dinghuibacter sp.]HTJ13034.1 M1 family metallopeptidase [Dinghuibacter sp.]
MRKILLAVFAASATLQAAAQYKPSDLFGPRFYTERGNAEHSANGAPGPAYWQNRADYHLQATIDTLARTLTGVETIEYTNNSPDALDCLWLQVEQNTYKPDARSNFATAAHPSPADHTTGYSFEAVTLQDGTTSTKADYIITDTRMQIRLHKPLASKGKVSIHIRYTYTIPGAFGGRTDYVATRNGTIFEIAQWYPRMSVYDDSRGWNNLPFLGSGEFYLEYGDIDYSVTVPWDMIVAGSGALQNPAEVLTPAQVARWEKARHSDQTVMIRSAAEIGDPSSRPVHSGTLTWKFKMTNTRDVAFGASRAYIWDAAAVNLPEGKHSMAMSVYPVESAGEGAWGRATEYLKRSMEYFSEKWFVYPYPVAVNEAGIAGGMEYPGIVFDGITDKGKELYWVTAHEIGHNWFPMIVGSDERRFGWMDEGFNTFIDVYASDNFNKGEYAPKRDAEYAEGGGNPADEIVPFLKDASAPVILTPADAIPEKYRHPLTYFKPAFGLVLLREQILGHDRFDYAFRSYIRHWAYKHPQPSDFFRSMENASGEDLAWFWREWFYHNWTLDLAVSDAHAVDGGVSVVVSNLDRMAFPSVLEATCVDGLKARINFFVETWLQQDRVTVVIPTTAKVSSVTIDPDAGLPDANRSNNTVKLP